MDMKVIHGLPAVRFAVNNKAGALPGAALSGRKFPGLVENPAQQSRVTIPKLHDVRNVLFGDYQKMNRRLGGNIVKGENLLVLKDLPGRNFALYDSTKNTVTHRISVTWYFPLFQ
jgi:hypothetical protein